MPSSDPQSNPPSKRRACDECRSRKLACSKEPVGCARCIRENVRCHYSEQKPMGRPRKRQCNGDMKESTQELDYVVPSLDPMPHSNDNFQIDPFIDFGELPFSNDIEGYSMTLPNQIQGKSLHTGNDGRLLFPFGGEHFNPPIDFGADETSTDESPPPVVPSTNEATITASHLFEAEMPYTNAPGPPCSCLPTMYLAMSSLQEFPADVETALATVRAAAKTAQAAVRCEKCGSGVTTGLHPPIEAFQNTMLLGTILPIIVNGYKRLLVMVDSETEIAQMAGVKKTFRMLAYGGLSGSEMRCEKGMHLDEAIMEPTEWRAAVRGLLRVDVYGMEGFGTGLKGIISEVEQRQRERHKQLDHWRDIGLLENVGYTQCLGEKDMLCLRILDTAKMAMDSLIIA